MALVSKRPAVVADRVSVILETGGLVAVESVADRVTVMPMSMDGA